MTALLSFTRLMSFIHREYGVEKVNDIRLDVYIFIGLGALYSTDRSDTNSFDSHAVLFILINFSLAAVKCAQLIPFLLPMPQSVQCVMRSQNMLVCYLK